MVVDQPQLMNHILKLNYKKTSKETNPKAVFVVKKTTNLEGRMATGHTSYRNTETVADQPQLVNFQTKPPQKEEKGPVVCLAFP